MSETDNQTAQDLAGEIEALRDRQDRLEEENEQLRKQNEELGKTVQQLQAKQGIDLPKPSRRQMLKAGGAGLATLLFGGAATGNVAAFDGDSDPEVGSDSFRYDWYLDSLDANTVNTDKASIKTQSDRFLYAAAYDGADIDSRLSSALSDASAGDTIILEKGLYGDATIDQRVTMQGATNRSGSVCAISGTWTLSDRAVLQGVRVDSGASVEADADFIEVSQASHAGSININGSKTLIYGCVGGSVTFASGTSAGLVDACSGMSVTDNGSNTVRDIA